MNTYTIHAKQQVSSQTHWWLPFQSIHHCLIRCTANPTWGDIFECCFKAQSSKLERLFSLQCGKRDVRALSFELSNMTPQAGLAVHYITQNHQDKHSIVYKRHTDVLVHAVLALSLRPRMGKPKRHKLHFCWIFSVLVQQKQVTLTWMYVKTEIRDVSSAISALVCGVHLQSSWHV